MARRTRSPHPGVVLNKRTNPDGRTIWRARYRDPDSGRLVFLKLDPLACSTEESRTTVAKHLAKKLAVRRMELAAGAQVVTSTPLATAVAEYFVTCEARLRPATVRGYRDSVGIFTSWAAKHGVRDVEDLTPAHVARFRESIISRRVTHLVEGDEPGAKTRETSPMSPASMNHYLRPVSAFLNAARRLGCTPRLSRDQIAESLERLPMPRPEPDPLKPDALRSIIGAASGSTMRGGAEEARAAARAAACC